MASTIPVKRMTEPREMELLRPYRMLEEMEEWAERMLPWRPFAAERMFWGGALPQVDILDRENELVVHAAVPGFGKDDIEVTATRDAVTIRGQSRTEKKTEEGGEYYCREIRREDFLRTIHLPCLVDDTRAKATFHDGLLELTLPKVEAAKRHTLKIEEA